MDNKTLNRILSILETAEEFYVPVKKMWKELREEGYELPSLDDFFSGLQSDARLEVREFGKKQEPDDEKEMEELGFYSGPRVKLKKRKITKENMERITLKHAQNVINNLVEAYQVRPENLPPESEDDLIELMRRSKALKQEIDKIFQNKPTT